MRVSSQSKPQPPPASNPMRQLVLLCVMLVLVLVIMSRAREPGMWTWLTGLDADGPAAGERLGHVTTRIDGTGDEAAEGTLVAVPRTADSPEPEQSSASGSVNDRVPAAPAVDPTVFDGVQDKTGVIPRRAYFHLLDVARRMPAEELQRVARSDRTFAHFALSPTLHRGKPIFLKGWLQRLIEITPPTNREGFDRLYEGWLYTEESQGNPYVIVISELPPGMPLGGDVRETVTFTGFFVKLWSYQSGDGQRFAPLLVGRSITWHERPAATGPSPTAYAASLAIVVVLICVLFGAMWWSKRSVASIRHSPSLTEPPAPEGGAAMQRMAGISTEEFLAQMEHSDDEPRGG
jgi:hypothetical protein